MKAETRIRKLRALTVARGATAAEAKAAATMADRLEAQLGTTVPQLPLESRTITLRSGKVIVFEASGETRVVEPA